jgi:glycosyltransferase involved in cell wall biosynthesis
MTDANAHDVRHDAESMSENHKDQLKIVGHDPLVSVVMPCLNEEAAIGSCIESIQRTFENANINGEIIVCDNGSTDNSVSIAEHLGARVVHEPRRGYGNAYIKGFAGAQGKYLIMGDADDTYDFTMIPIFLSKLIKEGYEFVTGSRYLEGGDEHITTLHRFFGNPALTAILNSLFRTSYSDVYCGLRGFSREAYDRIQPVSPGMEFNLELAINASKANLKIAEIPIKLRPRKGEAKIRTIRDGWRSLRMMLLYSPNHLFVWPGTSLFILGIFIHILLLFGLITWDGRPASGVTGVFATILSVLGFQILSLGLHAKTYSWTRRFDENNVILEWFYKHFKLEKGLILGAAMIMLGGGILTLIIIQWLTSRMLPLPHPEWASLAATLIIIGCGVLFTSLFISSMSFDAEKGSTR